MPQPTIYLTPEDVAERLHVHPETVRRQFEGRKGVIDIGSGSKETMHKRRYRVLRIPEECYESYLREKTVRSA